MLSMFGGLGMGRFGPGAGTVRGWGAGLGLSLGLFLGGCGVMAAGPGMASAPLYGTTWALVPLNGPVPEPAVPLNVQAAQLRFEAEPARVSGSTGCNRLTGGYTVDGGRLSFSAPAATRRACLDEAMETEQAFLAGLDKVRGWRIEGALLLLTDAAGVPVLRLRAAP
jgi:heat shock protein HslJ